MRTFYQQLADEFMKELDKIAPIIPQLEASRISTVNFVRSHLNVPNEFLATAIAAAEQTPVLREYAIESITGMSFGP